LQNIKEDEDHINQKSELWRMRVFLFFIQRRRCDIVREKQTVQIVMKICYRLCAPLFPPPLPPIQLNDWISAVNICISNCANRIGLKHSKVGGEENNDLFPKFVIMVQVLNPPHHTPTIDYR
jgi:hypothetical protein